MRVLFIGLGSIAKRHIYNLKELLGREIHITVLRSGKGTALSNELSDCIDQICYDAGELSSCYNAVFITNPTSEHYGTLLKYHLLSKYFFIEKPVFMTGNENIEVFQDDGNIYYVACPLRYTNIVQYLKKNIDFSLVYSVRCISSSYLPDWRAGADYRTTYSARKDMGGGVSIDLIHEWDYLCYLMGFPRSVKSIIGKKSDLEINSDDVAIYIADYSDKVVELHLDYFGRFAIRRIELFTKNDTIVADLIHQRIEWMNTGKKIEMDQERDEYQKRELTYFLDLIKGQCECDNTLPEAFRVLRLAKGKL